MRKWQHTITMIIMVMALMYVMVGCGKVNASPSDMDTLSVMKDGSIVQMIIDHFDQNYYDVEELSAMTQEKIGLYSEGDGDIVCEAVEENDGVITVKIAYQTGEAYADFNGSEFFFGTVRDAASAGYSIKDMVSNDGQALTDAELEQLGDNHAVIIQTEADEELCVNVYDKILYISADAVLSGKKDAIIEAGEEDKLSCIIFK